MSAFDAKKPRSRASRVQSAFGKPKKLRYAEDADKNSILGGTAIKTKVSNTPSQATGVTSKSYIS